ncbi:OLC1v1014773C1 [Oldenlandia corymbosa var. corymbosa]|uniref:Peroxidase n=1 Tax=Oldenlandia corymbosa var. corymbosa TaxID=529605 RepID=A0AAV1E5E9_OLDCO|nr:OLC1v1014773C1 [Oldenlandia corymbosa var. corymbosa]
MDFTRKLSFLVFILCLLFSLKNQNAETNKGSLNMNWFSSYSSPFSKAPLESRPTIHHSSKLEWNTQDFQYSGFESLRYDYYSDSCPGAERIIRSTVRELYNLRPSIVPELLRLVFHDCFIQGCDASVLLDSSEEIHSEKDSPPNESLKGFDQIDIIKEELEEVCPGVVSCADIVVLAARESVILAGGPFYPLYTGRKDSTRSFSDEATFELPSPDDDIIKMVQLFESRGFDSRETVSLLGAHSTGVIHCKFIANRLYNFGGTHKPDPSIDPEFLNTLRTKCTGIEASFSTSASPSRSPSGSPSPSPSSPSSALSSALIKQPGMRMDYEGPRADFGTLYYRSLLQNRGILFVDQQLTASEETQNWVRGYASDASLFGKDFAMAMMKLSSYQVLTAPKGQVRSDCRKVA